MELMVTIRYIALDTTIFLYLLYMYIEMMIMPSKLSKLNLSVTLWSQNKSQNKMMIVANFFKVILR